MKDQDGVAHDARGVALGPPESRVVQRQRGQHLAVLETEVAEDEVALRDRRGGRRPGRGKGEDEKGNEERRACLHALFDILAMAYVFAAEPAVALRATAARAPWR